MSEAPHGGGSRSLEATAHVAAVLDAEARRLARTLERYGVLTRWQLAERSGARLWLRGRFQRALEVGVEREMIRPLGFGFYAPNTPWPTKPHARITDAVPAAERRFRVGVRRLDRAK